MSNPLFEMRKDPEKEKDGAWYDYLPTKNEAGETENPDGSRVMVRFKMRRTGGSNTKFLAAVEKASEPYKNDKDIDAEKQLKIMQEVFCDHILVDWENVQNEEGEYIEFSKENAMHIFELLPDVYHHLLLEVKSGQMFKLEKAREDDAKN